MIGYADGLTVGSNVGFTDGLDENEVMSVVVTMAVVPNGVRSSR